MEFIGKIIFQQSVWFGMNEACENLLKCGIADEEGHDFAVEVMDYMRDLIVKFQQETGNNYNLEATPAEGTSYRLGKIR